jgi:hypothetical protein
MLKKSDRELYKKIRDSHPANDKPTRRFWKSCYITSPNHAGLYIERVAPSDCKPMYYLKQIARDSKQPVFDGCATIPYINSVPNTDGTGATHFYTEWDARQALKLFTTAYNAASARELEAWHNAHTITESRDTPKIVIFYFDGYKKSCDVDTDNQRNGKGARLWV